MTTEERLAKVERELRRVKRWSGWLLVGLALALGVSVLVAIFGPEKAGLQFGASVVNKVRTRRVVLVDDEGRERARLAMTEDGGPGLALFDQAGEKRAALGVDADGPKIVLFDPAGEPICSAP